VALAAIGVSVSVWLLNRPGRVPAAVSVPVPLTSYLGSEWWPSFSSEGDRLAFAWNSPKQDDFDIYVKQIGENEPVRLTQDPADEYAPAWSPDGARLPSFEA
jgi:Tol biopolymer transport system component